MLTDEVKFLQINCALYDRFLDRFKVTGDTIHILRQENQEGNSWSEL